MEHIIEFIDRMEEYLWEREIPGQNFFRLDVDWNAFGKNPGVRKRQWEEVKRIEDHCKEIGLPFSMIYWASDVAGSEALRADESSWYNSLMKQGKEYAAVGGDPDQYDIQTWIEGIPHTTLPETADWTFTRSVLDFYNRFIAE